MITLPKVMEKLQQTVQRRVRPGAHELWMATFTTRESKTAQTGALCTVLAGPFGKGECEMELTPRPAPTGAGCGDCRKGAFGKVALCALLLLLLDDKFESRRSLRSALRSVVTPLLIEYKVVVLAV